MFIVKSVLVEGILVYNENLVYFWLNSVVTIIVCVCVCVCVCVICCKGSARFPQGFCISACFKY